MHLSQGLASRHLSGKSWAWWLPRLSGTYKTSPSNTFMLFPRSQGSGCRWWWLLESLIPHSCARAGLLSQAEHKRGQTDQQERKGLSNTAPESSTVSLNPRCLPGSLSSGWCGPLRRNWHHTRTCSVSSAVPSLRPVNFLFLPPKLQILKREPCGFSW